MTLLTRAARSCVVLTPPASGVPARFATSALLTCALSLCGHAPAAVAQGERVPESAVVNGVPQGLFVGRSLLTGRAVCLLFLGGGRITRAIPEGGLERFDWERHRAAHPGDSGQWEMRGSQLVAAWGDGGVHQGPLVVHPDSIEFYGKRYARPLPVGIAAIAGRWESARGTAIAGGAGVNTVSTLVIGTDGRYQWVSTTGGVVSGRATASERSMSGQATITGLTLTLRSDAGVSTSYTFLPVAGQPVSAFSVDATMFTRTGPPPVEARSGPGPAAGANTDQGLQFSVPTGWASGTEQGRLVLVPADATPESAVIVALSAVEPLSSRALDEWLAGRMQGDLGTVLKTLQAAPVQRGRSGALETATAGRTVQDGAGGVRLQIYHAISDGQRVGLALVIATSEAAMTKYMSGVQAIIQSLRLPATPIGMAAPSSPAPVPVPKREITVADLVGSWEHASSTYTSYTSSTGGSDGSSTTAYGQGYTFAADGTYTYRFTGMMDRVYLREKDSGSWGFENGRLVTRSREGRRPKIYQIVQYESAADSSVTMTLLASDYPITSSNVAVYGERYARRTR